MDNNTRNSVILIHALLAGIEVVNHLNIEGKKPSERREYYVIIFIDDREVIKSEKKSRQNALRWEWPKDHQFEFHPSSVIRIAIYWESWGGIRKHIVGQHIGNVVELLDNDAIINLIDENGVEIASIKIKLSLALESEDVVNRFMKTVDDDNSRLENAGLPLATTSVLYTISAVLHLTKVMMDVLASTHPIFRSSWTVMTAVYMAVKEAEKLDDTVLHLAEILREMLGIVREYSNILLIEGTTNVIEEIGRISLKVASLIHKCTRSRFVTRAARFQLSDNMISFIEQYQEILDNLKQKFNTRVNVDTLIKDSRLGRNILQWLSAPDSSRSYNKAYQRYQMGTCFWFLEGTRFREFQEKADFLWIKGKAGSGKTILCSSIIANIIQLREKNPSIACAYFFFDGRDSQKDLQLHDQLIRCLILQLVLQCNEIPVALAELYGYGHQQPSTKSLENVLYDIIGGMNSVYVIIDSLDECAEKEVMLEWIEEIVKRRISTLHMMVLSRPEPDIEKALRPLDAHYIDLANESERDIMLYLEKELSEFGEHWDKATLDNVKSRLAERADGMFRWVALQLGELKYCKSQDSVMKELERLPQSLYEVYDQILLKIDEADHDNIRTFLRWLCFSIRPMTLSEIAEVVVIDFDATNGPYYNPLHRHWDQRNVLEKCSGLINVESEGIIQLAHSSIKEYFLSNHFRTTSFNFHLATDQLSHSLISQTCLAYLLQFDADSFRDSKAASSFPLARYAAEHWIFHAKAGGIDRPEASWTLTLATKLFTHPRAAFTNWVQIWDLDNPYKSHKPRSIAPPLYYASLAGLQQLCLYLLNLGVNVNMHGGQYGTALQAASNQGHKAIIELLLKNGADLNAQGGECDGNALYAVSYQGQKVVVELLLEKGADPDTQGGLYGNALQAASYQGHEAVVKVLLEKGANLNAQGGEYANALHAASYQGHKAVVEMLLLEQANPNAQGGLYSNALQAASSEGHEEIVKMLLKKGADPNAQGGFFGNALQAASAGGHKAVVKVLLEKNVDAKAQGGHYGNALQAASIRGHEVVKALLLEKGTHNTISP